MPNMMPNEQSMFKPAYQLYFSTTPVFVIVPSPTLSAMRLRGSDRPRAKERRCLKGAHDSGNHIKSHSKHSSNESPYLQLIDAAP